MFDDLEVMLRDLAEAAASGPESGEVELRRLCSTRLYSPETLDVDEDDLVSSHRDLEPRLTYEEGTEAPENRLEELRHLAIRAGEDEARAKSEDFADRLFTFTGSDDSVDRYGCRVLIDGKLNGKEYGPGWDLRNFKRAPRFMEFHDYHSMPIGRAVDVWTDVKRNRNRLRFTILMDPGFENGGASESAVQWTRAFKSRLVDTVSVGWLPRKVYRPVDEDERKQLGLGPYGVLFIDSELLELSGVPIPGNANAREEKGTTSDKVLRRALREMTKAIEALNGTISLVRNTGEPKKETEVPAPPAPAPASSQNRDSLRRLLDVTEEARAAAARLQGKN